MIVCLWSPEEKGERTSVESGRLIVCQKLTMLGYMGCLVGLSGLFAVSFRFLCACMWLYVGLNLFSWSMYEVR